ncbi:DUF5998 family protein [Trueperella pecoris]|uniref:Uncharacterized protein n=1 Tax=Trueperella pecoris TaxID=2733571 RepID=A0A7M1QWZ3_9ACTO|nr:DUF5998 family protein [Trueperella pecoris]QOQ38914.1 hypothetical protein HLG82_05295 [Trueperella pecoris]QOR46458.1 hypothetical protein INS88_04490 [Trueperella pecoris]QTG76284.1 hypothetical protein J4179_04420 [Trueperella pecoris]
MNDLRSDFDEALAHLVSGQSPVLADIRHVLGNDAVRAFYVRPETVFDADSVYDRIVAFIVTGTRLLLVYSDTNYEMDTRGEYVTTTQSVRLADIREHHVIRRREFKGDSVGELNSILLRLRWGSSFNQDLQPGACDDPACTNDHGYVGVATNEDLQIFLDRHVDTAYFREGVDFINSLEDILGQR